MQLWRLFLQQLDVSINKSFKGFFREMYDEWFRAGEFEYTRGGNIKPPPSYQEIVWISEAYKKVTQAVVKKSFEACGISKHDRDVISCVQPGATAEDAYDLLNFSNNDVQLVLDENSEADIDIFEDSESENLELEDEENVFIVQSSE